MNSRDWVEFMYGNVMDVVASTIRAGITAPPGKMLVVSDLSSIESRVLGRMSECKWINEIFAEGRDTYRSFAVELFNVPYERVTKQQRNFSKPPFLGCGYRLAGKGLMKYGAGMGVEMTGKEAKRAVRIFREHTPEISDPQAGMWAWLDWNIKDVVQYGNTYEGFSVRLRRDEQFLMVDLPSGRTLYYYQPQIQPTTITITDPETDEEREWHTEAVTYMGQDTYTHQWKRIKSHGGKFTENFDQAESRDILAEGIRLAEADPLLEVVGHVHDEIISLADEANAEEALRRQNEYMSRPVSWAPGLLLGAEGYTARRYRKE